MFWYKKTLLGARCGMGYSGVDEEMLSALPLHQILFTLDGDGKLVRRVVVWSSSVLGCLSYS